MDVFLAHNSRDKPFVRSLAQVLRDRGIEVWLDETDLPPNKLINDVIEEVIAECRAVAICFGGAGEGPVQHHEIDQAFNLAMHRNKSIMTVLLPGVDESIRPQKLRGYRPIRFAREPDEDKPIYDLIWGIRDEKPQQPPLAPAMDTSTPGDPVEDALNKLRDARYEEGINVFIGPLCAVSEAAAPGPYEIARSLLRKLELIPGDHSGVLPAPDTAGSCYAIRQGPDGLERALCGEMRTCAHLTPSFYERLAALIGRMEIPEEHRGRRRVVSPLLLTTNLDVFMERALLASGVSFSRIVHNISRGCLHIHAYEGAQRLDGGGLSLRDSSRSDRNVVAENLEELDAWIRQAGHEIVGASSGPYDSGGIPLAGTYCLDRLPGPILYKYHGSQDVPGSCAVTTEQYFALTRGTLPVPRQLRERLANSPSLFLGYGFLCSAFYQIYESLLRDAFSQRPMDARYAVREDREPEENPNLLMENAVRHKLKLHVERMGLELLTVSPAEFIERLNAGIGE